MLEILRLIRIRTIAFAALTMYAMRYFVILPMLEINDFTLQMTHWAFSLSVISVCCLISGAYVINDYFDTKSDRISGVKNVVVGRSVSRRAAIILHSILNVIAVGIAFYLGFAVGVWKIGILFLLVSGILWFYSSSYKKYFMVGNILVGILASLIPVCAIVYEIPLLNMAYADILLKTDTNFVYMFNWVFCFSWFIFLNILIYEINKDIYTVEGDRENGNNTIPVKLGKKTAIHIITFLVLIAMASVVLYYYIEFTISFAMLIYLIVAILLPYAIYLLLINGKKENRRLQLGMIRLIMVLCIGFSLFLKHFFNMIFSD
ncbi:MAG: geranylgeranylglycerol-phosphate geranylgeranyltransferase [Odoribacter sp.]